MNAEVLLWILRVAKHGRMTPSGHHDQLDAIAHDALARLRALKGVAC